MGFLFLDPALKEKSPAWKSWPTYLRQAAEKAPGNPQRLLFAYLVRMEPDTPVDFYVDSWTRVLPDLEIGEPFGPHEHRLLSPLPLEKRRSIVRALLHEAERLETAIAGERYLRSALIDLEDPDETARVIEELEADAEDRRKKIADWLRYSRPDHSLVDTLSRNANPELRQLVLGAIEAYPTKSNRAILQRLLADSDDEVRAVARRTLESLSQLASTSPSEFRALKD